MNNKQKTKTIELREIALADIKPAKYNPRKIDKENLDGLKESLKIFGQRENLVVNKDMTLISGHQRYKAMVELGWSSAFCDVLELSKQDEKKLNLTFNNPNIQGKFEKQGLESILAELKLSSSMDALRLPQLSTLAPEVKEDEAPELSKSPPKSKLGEVYLLGRHRVICGDATNSKHVHRLMDSKQADLFITDPPYGVAYADKNKSLNAIGRGNRIQTPIENDHMSVDEMKELWTKSFINAFNVTKDTAPYYINAMQGGDLMMMMMMMMSILNSGWNLKHMMIWAKNNHVLGRMDYHYRHEPIFYGWKEGKSHNWYGDHSQTSLWDINKPQKSDLHPTMKPIALISKAINNSSKKGDIILDLFLGSGSTLIACEQLDRICYGMELDPKYVDVIRKRYWKFVNGGDEMGWEQNTPVDKTP